MKLRWSTTDKKRFVLSVDDGCYAVHDHGSYAYAELEHDDGPSKRIGVYHSAKEAMEACEIHSQTLERSVR